MSRAISHTAMLPVESVRIGTFQIPTDLPESDGTLEWDATTLVVIEIASGKTTGLGYTYGNASVAEILASPLAGMLEGRDAADIPALWSALSARLRNVGRQGVSAMAISAIDVALWDLKARHLSVPLIQLLGAARSRLLVYGSGGFTSYTDRQLEEQFSDWAARGVTRFKMKVGREFVRDPERVRSARAVIGPDAQLFVDANSAYSRSEALEFGTRFADDCDVRWLEQPLPPEDLNGLRFLRERTPAKLEIADGEYGYDLDYFRRVLEADAIDVVMADLTRCGGITGFLKVAALCDAWSLPLSSHCAPALHVHPGCAVPALRHAEYFHDHARIERMLFDGAPALVDGALTPDLSRVGHGLEFKWPDAERYAR